MFAKRVHPDIMFKFWIPYADVAGHTLCEALEGEVTEHTGSVDENVASVLLETRELWDSCAVLVYQSGTQEPQEEYQDWHFTAQSILPLGGSALKYTWHNKTSMADGRERSHILLLANMALRLFNLCSLQIL